MKRYVIKILAAVLFVAVVTVSFCGVIIKQPIRPKLSLITPDGDDMAYHPSVVTFDEEWNGYKYWIAFTPYPNADETKENPVINASNNLVKWYVPEGLENPIDKPTVDECRNYNSDTHLLYNDKENRLELFWRYVRDINDDIGSVTIFRSVSYDGVHWEPKTEFLFSENRNVMDWISPAVCFENGVYKIWYVDVDKKVHYLEMKDGKPYNEPIQMNIPFEADTFAWHIDVKYNEDKQIYELVTCAYKSGEGRQTMSLYYTSSKDNINWSKPQIILKPSPQKSDWDSHGIYRASLLYSNGVYYIFYSAHNLNKINVGVGLVCGRDISNLGKYNIVQFF